MEKQPKKKKQKTKNERKRNENESASRKAPKIYRIGIWRYGNRTSFNFQANRKSGKILPEAADSVAQWLEFINIFALLCVCYLHSVW